MIATSRSTRRWTWCGGWMRWVCVTKSSSCRTRSTDSCATVPGSRPIRPRLRTLGRCSGGADRRGGLLPRHDVAGQHANAETAHLAGQGGEDVMAVLEQHAEHRVGQHVGDHAIHLNRIYFGHDARRLGSGYTKAEPARGRVPPGTLYQKGSRVSLRSQNLSSTASAESRIAANPASEIPSWASLAVLKFATTP